MPDVPAYAQMMRDFAVELRKIAYTMPAGHEDRLISLSDRIVRQSIKAQMDGLAGT